MVVGPVMKSLCEHWNLFVQTKVRVRTQAILTQLVFEHSLRIRVKAEIPDSGSAEVGETQGAVVPQSELESDSAAANTETSAIPGDVTQANKPSGDTENLIGKINNLVTSDMENISNGADFLSFSKFIPVSYGEFMTYMKQLSSFRLRSFFRWYSYIKFSVGGASYTSAYSAPVA